MYILIDNSGEEISFFYCLDTDKKQDWVRVSYPSEKEGSLLEALNKLLSKLKLDVSDLKGLAVVVGKGKFTSTRVATTIVNSLAYTLRIPVVGVTSVETSNLVEEITNTPVGQYVSAAYSAEPNIGKKKKI